MNNYIPIFAYPGGNLINAQNLPPKCTFRRIDSYGGGSLDGPIKFGTITPKGNKAHGGVLTIVDGNPVVEYHRMTPPKIINLI